MAVSIPQERQDEIEQAADKAMNEIKQFEKNIIKLRLDDMKDADAVTDQEFIVHVAEYNRIKELISESLRAARDYANGHSVARSSVAGRNPCLETRDICNGERVIKRSHDTIMLAGVRGSGKTTFMLSILDHIKNGRLDIRLGEDSHAECGIEILPIFDPTLIEDKTHIFANIISMIKDKVDRRAKKENCFSNDSSDSFKKFQCWEKSFRDLAEGLPCIDGLGGDSFNSDAWLDPEFVMKKSVSLANAANKLEATFHEFVRQSLCFLCKDAFFLCFDDVDTNFGKGWPVLEVLHKYLTTPQLITVLSGDPSLYSTLIRDNQWKNFSDKLLRMECQATDDRQGFKDVVAHLEEQYFLKLLKPQRRIFLNNLYQLNNTGPVRVIYDGSKAGEYLEPMYERLLSNLGAGRADKTDSYRFLASLPLRSQKQLLFAFIRQERPTDTSRRFIQDVFDIFWSDLTVKKVNVSSLRNNPETVTIHALNYMVANGLLSEGYTLNQNFSDPLTNGSQFALGVVLHDQVAKDPSQIFEYWMRICIARELGFLMGDRIIARGEGPALQNFIDHCTLEQNQATRYLARFCTAYFRAFHGYNYKTKVFSTRRYEEKAWHGTLPLFALSEKQKDSGENIKNRIDYVLNHADTSPFIRILGSIPLSGATDHNKRALPIYSIYNILGILGQLVKTANSFGSNIEEAAQQVTGLLYRDAQFREYTLPNWATSHSAEPAYISGDFQSKDKQFDEITLEFSRQIVAWTKMEAGRNISASLLGKIFTRLFYTLNNLDKQFSKHLLGDWLHRMVVIFLNSVVIVEAMEYLNVPALQLQLTNPVTTDEVFINNLKKLNNQRENLSSDSLVFSKWILSCPLWKIYLDVDTDDNPLKSQIGIFIASYIEHQFTKKIINRDGLTSATFTQTMSKECLISILNKHNVLVRGYKDPAEKSETNSSEGPKIEFNFRHKNKLIDMFEDEAMSMESALDLTAEELCEFITKSGLANEYSFKDNIGSEVKKKIGKELTW